jgi:hypothetical protein
MVNGTKHFWVIERVGRRVLCLLLTISFVKDWIST